MRLFTFFIAGLGLAACSFALKTLSGPISTMQKWSYKDCGSPSDPLQINSIKIFPDPPNPGEDLTITIMGDVTEVIEEGAHADVTVKLGLIKLLREIFDVCEEARDANASVQCPVQTGSYIIEQTVALPKEIPQAKFTLNVRGYTVDDDDLFCLDFQVDFMI
ncbi:ML domain-containing protein [Flammula alnicola]|nr:ML domain-containing protein [Flammula alnicola]